MRVERSGAPTGIHKAKDAAGAKGKKASSSSSGDSVQVADSASLREKAMVMLAELDGVRMDRIEEIRDALEGGTFKSDSKKIAKQIVTNALAEHPW